ncbi:cytokine receptor-like factor 3 [Aethina tumida]|uniref:cytokine receptor-like factor 3 n=1 Tax=Aethina tumida TaxID=116153 RepID=UPI00096B424D|nr:cytokine receptor-like factor 3 [Aethina tumida]
MDKKEVSDTLGAAKIYLQRLKCLDKELQVAEKQVDNTYLEAEQIINDTFSNLKDTIIKILIGRRQNLIDQAQKVRKEGLTPLRDCRSVISDKMKSTLDLLKLGDSLLSGTNKNIGTFTQKSTVLGALPEVPELTEVPYISFQYEVNLEDELRRICSQIGEVSRIAPVQISELVQKPGAILVEWSVNADDERGSDIQYFRLQRAYGDVLNDKHLVANFVDCFEGLDTQFLAKDIQPNQPYSFRVCCKYEGSTEWSPWSLAKVAFTELKHFSWRFSQDYIVTNENKIARCTKSYPEVLFSEGPQFLIGHSIDFIFLEADSTDGIIGLLTEDAYTSVNHLRYITDGSFFIQRSGSIFVEGIEKSTKLPEFTKGQTISFTCEAVNENKVRVNIDSCNKRVTYEWPISLDTKMYFAAQFYSDKWKVMVE